LSTIKAGIPERHFSFAVNVAAMELQPKVTSIPSLWLTADWSSAEDEELHGSSVFDLSRDPGLHDPVLPAFTTESKKRSVLYQYLILKSFE
jgi:hypothetical protein